MPLYEYRCQACGAQEEKLEPISAPDSHACPECEASDGMKRQVSVAAFALSGGGWYKEGYGGGKADAKGEAKGGATGGTKPEAAPAAPAAKPAEAPAAPAKPAGGCGGGCACH